MYLYDTATEQCEPKKGEYEACTSTDQCLGPMTCTVSNQCECSFDKYFNSVSLTCVDRTLNYTTCSTSNTCRVDKGLSCQNQFCQCDLSAKYWHSTDKGCIAFIVYGETGCYADANCVSGKNLICNLDSSVNNCDCSLDSKNSMCDCKRVFGDEFYWDGSKCVAAKFYGESCDEDYECRTMTDSLRCFRDKCTCTSSKAYSSSTRLCGKNFDFLKFNFDAFFCLIFDFISWLPKQLVRLWW